MISKMTISLLAILIAVGSPVSAEVSGSLEDAVQEASALARDHLFDDAEIVLEDALRKRTGDEDPNSALAALWLLGLYRDAQEDYDGAAAAYRERLEFLAEHFETTATREERQTLQSLANAYDRAGRGDEARKIWMRLAEIERNDPVNDSLGVAYFGMARSFAREDRYKEAREYFDKTIEMRTRSGNKGALFNPLIEYAKLLRELGEVDRAEKLEETAHALMADVVRSTDPSSLQIIEGEGKGEAKVIREWSREDWENDWENLLENDK